MHQALATIQRPYFTILLKTASITYEVRFNDIPLDRGSDDMETEWPLNLWAFTGRNEIAIYVKDELVDASMLDIGLYVREINADYTSAIKISNLKVGVTNQSLVTTGVGKYPGSEEPVLEQIESGAYVIKRGVNLKVPFPGWVWLNSNIIPKNESTFKELLAQYNYFHGLLKTRNSKAIEESMAYSLKDYMASYYVSDYKQAVEDFEVSELAMDTSIQLAEIDMNDIGLQVFGNGRLARLVDKAGESPVKFIQNGVKIHIDFMYCHTSSGWLQIR